MKMKYTQKEKAVQLHKLHLGKNFIILPNIWDILGAKLLEDLEYPAIATASASVAYTNGYLDGEKIPFNDLTTILTIIVNGVNIPVTTDIESGYADDNAQFQENIKAIIKTGIVGINIEDTNQKTNSMFSVEDQCNRIKLIRAIADELDIPLFINARTDVLLYDKEFRSIDEQLTELSKRGLAYKEAGADCFFPIALRQKDSIEKLVNQLKMPINILVLPGIPELKVLKEIGVVRISLGPSFLKIAIKAMKSLAVELQNSEGLSAITENEISSDYLKSLINN